MRAVYKCSICKQPKKGHICSGMIETQQRVVTERSTTTKLLLHDLNSDILDKIYQEVANQHRDDIALLKKDYTKFIKDIGYLDIDFRNTNGANEDKFHTVYTWTWNYVYKQMELNKRLVDSIICSYGIAKAISLLWSFCNSDNCKIHIAFCEEMNTPFSGEKMIIQLILCEEVGFNLFKSSSYSIS